MSRILIILSFLVFLPSCAHKGDWYEKTSGQFKRDLNMCIRTCQDSGGLDGMITNIPKDSLTCKCRDGTEITF